MAGHGRFWTVLIIWTVYHGVTSQQHFCHITNGRSPLAGVNENALRFNFTPLKAMGSWGTTSLRIVEHQYELTRQNCRAMHSLQVYAVTESVNTNTSLCRVLTGSQVHCSQMGKTNLLITGAVAKFGSCDVDRGMSPTWNNYSAIILKFSFLVYPDDYTSRFVCKWSGLYNILNFTLDKIGCPIGYWGTGCSMQCSSCEHCHTFTGACLPNPYSISTATTGKGTETTGNFTFTPTTASQSTAAAGHQCGWSTTSLMAFLVLFIT